MEDIAQTGSVFFEFLLPALSAVSAVLAAYFAYRVHRDITARKEAERFRASGIRLARDLRSFIELEKRYLDRLEQQEDAARATIRNETRRLAKEATGWRILNSEGTVDRFLQRYDIR